MIKLTNRNKIFFGGIVGLSLIGMYLLLRNYLPIIAISLTYAVTIYPIYRIVLRLLRGHRKSATVVTVIASFIIIVLPIVFTTNLLVQEAFNLRENISIDITSYTFVKGIEKINEVITKLPLVEYELTVPKIQSWILSLSGPLSSFLLNLAINVGTSSVAIITNILVFLIVLFSVLPGMPTLRDLMKKISPLGDEIDQLYISRTSAMVTSMVKGTFLISIIQGIVTGLVMYFLGIKYTVILSLIVIILGILPIVGGNLITIPLSIWLILTGNVVGGVILLFTQLVVLTIIDNGLRPLMVSKEANLHPALLLLGVFGGLQLFGPLGFIYGPVVMILFVTTLEIYTKYYRD